MSHTPMKTDLLQREMTVFSTIPGMQELLRARPEEATEIGIRFPDAAFALHTANNLFNHNRELSLITQKAYFSILNGESIPSVRFRYERDTDAYWKEHMWDD